LNIIMGDENFVNYFMGNNIYHWDSKNLALEISEWKEKIQLLYASSSSTVQYYMQFHIEYRLAW
jgi:hypothetical protein